MSGGSYKKSLSGSSFFSGSALVMAFSLLSVIVLLFWWQSLITRHLEVQYRYFAAQLKVGSPVSEELLRLIHDQDEKLARELFAKKNITPPNFREIIAMRLENRKKMVVYEHTFFIFLLLSGHLFLIYIYFRERSRRKLTEETILLATHELRQPLQSLSLALETLAHDATGTTKKAIVSGLNDINRLGEHIRWLAGAFAPIKNNRTTAKISNLAIWFARFADTEFSKRERQRLSTNFPQESVELIIEEKLLRFVLRNLTENALRYAQGSVKVTASIQPGWVSFTVSNATTEITKKDFSRLGSVFFRSPNAAVQNTPGFGLGLYLCGRIARHAKGKLTLTTENGRMHAQFSIRRR